MTTLIKRKSEPNGHGILQIRDAQYFLTRPEFFSQGDLAWKVVSLRTACQYPGTLQPISHEP